ncbi:MAG: hypothetical protein J5527_04530 [Treponema sp.]|nr:hypothetical protein [Treponema sp.]
MKINIKRISENILLSTLLVCFLSFSACKAYTDQTEKIIDESNYATVYIQLNTTSLENYTSITSARTATPILPDSIRYNITANGTGSLPTNYNNKNDWQSDTSFPANKKYMLKLPAGTWTVTVTGQNSNSQTILSGTSESFTVEANGEYHESVYVDFIKDEVGKGRINLEIETTDTNISYVKISGVKLSGIDQIDPNKKFTVQPDGSRNVIKLDSGSNNILSHNYSSILTFYYDDDSIATIIFETINIRNNMVTDTWYKSGKAIYLKKKTDSTDGKADFILTQEVIDYLENSTFYVSKDEGLDTNDGTRQAPYATLDAALKRVINLNNANFYANASGHPSKSFTIICDGEIENTNDIQISPEHNLNLIIKSLDSNQPAKLKASVFRLIGDQDNTITFDTINLEGDIQLSNGKLIMDSVAITGYLDYYGGQLTLGGNISFSNTNDNDISLYAANKTIHLSKLINSTNTIKIAPISSLVSSYTTNYVLIEGTGSGTVANSLSKFEWGNSDYVLSLVNEKAVLAIP